MKLTTLLAQRQALLRQSHLANLAFAHERLSEFARRITRAGLRGPVVLKRADPENGRDWPVLIALRGSQSVLDEHFAEEDVIDLADVIAYALDAQEAEVAFDLGELKTLFLRPVHLALEEAGVQIDALPPSVPPHGLQHDDLHSSACDDDEL
jgi:hypothetical protein